MRVLFATNMWPDEHRPYYGSFIESQAESLQSVGITVDVLYICGYHARRAYLRAIGSIPHRARVTTYDLIHTHFGHTLAASALVRGLPLVASFCGEDLLGAPRDGTITAKSRAEVAVFRQLARLATRTITKSQQMETALPASLQPRNHVLPNGVDIDRFRWRDKTDARKQLGWPADGRVMLFLGNPDDPRKNVQLARDAAELVRKSDPEARLEIVWKVPVAKVPTIMNAADVLIFPSRSEGSPNAVKEAMASELPIVATPVGDVPERLVEVDGCFVRSAEPEPFAKAICDSLSHGRARAARTAAEALSTERIAERLAAIYTEACGNGCP